MAPVWSSQPLKAVYTVSFLALAFPRVLLLMLKYSIPALRPIKEWSMSLNLTNALVRMFFKYLTATRSSYIAWVDPAKAKECHVRVEPVATQYFQGVAASREAIATAPLDAVWFPSPPPSGNEVAEIKKQKVVLHLPGGAFVMRFGYAKAGGETAKIMADYFKADRTVWAEYRLALTPETRFPAALQDALTFYHYVLSLGYDPKNVILSGDSAGGNLAIALLRYLESTQREEQHLPLPGGAIAISPWVHVTLQAGKDYSAYQYAKSDCLIPGLAQWGAEAYYPQGEISDEVQAYISPLHHPFKTSVPMLLQDGGVEAFHASIQAFAEEMTEVNGGLVKYVTVKLAPHDLVMSHETFNVTEEFGAAFREARELFDSVQAAAEA